MVDMKRLTVIHALSLSLDLFLPIGTAIQATYTSAFGLIAALLFMRTGNVFAPITSHMIVRYAHTLPYI